MDKFIYNQDLALKAGQSPIISETGAYICTIKSAVWIISRNGAFGLELAVETNEGQKADFIDIFYKSKEGEEYQGGINMINAIMGCAGVTELTKQMYQGQEIAPQLLEKRVGLFLQKRLYTKQNGQDGFGLQVVCPFSAQSRKTLREHLENRSAEYITHLENTILDRDERNQGYQNSQGYQASNNAYGQLASPPQNAYAQATQRSYGNNPATAQANTTQGQSFTDDDIPF